MASQNKQRRRLIVEKSFQLKYAFLFALVCLILGVISTGATVAFSQSYMAQLEKAGAFLTPTLADVYHRGWIRLVVVLGGLTLGYSLLAFYVGLVLTRNIVGPVLAFRSSVTRLLKGEKEDSLQLRHQDELKILKEIYSDIASSRKTN